MLEIIINWYETALDPWAIGDSDEPGDDSRYDIVSGPSGSVTRVLST
jgi:hypothetical protein